MISAQTVFNNLNKVREKSPLIHNITNYVVMNNTANAQLAIGASPVMAHAIDEVEDMLNIASALVINMGTLDEQWVESMIVAAEKANNLNIPIIFDPVGSGATPYRIKVAKQILSSCKPTVIRGNASEIMSLLDEKSKTKGVDSSLETQIALYASNEIARKYNCIVIVSGENDIICNGDETIYTKNGSALMTKVTGLGCTATSIVAAFVVVERNTLLAAANAMSLMGIAGEIAANNCDGPASLQVKFIDKLYNITLSEIEKTIKL